MITRAQMRRQLRAKGGIMNVAPREKFGLGSKIKDRIRKLIPNEIANIAVKAAPFVAPFNPAIAGIMRGVGRFEQRGSISDALKQGLGTFAAGAGARYLGGQRGMSNITGGGLRGGLTNPLSAENVQKGKALFQGKKLSPEEEVKKKLLEKESIKNTPGIIQTGVEKTIDKVPLLKDLPPMVQQQSFVGGITGGASALHDYFTKNFREKLPEETVEQYLEARRKRVGIQMRSYMDNYFTFDPEYSALDDAGKDAFVARYNKKKGGRVGLASGSPHFDPPTKSEGVEQLFVSDALGALPKAGGGVRSEDMGILSVDDFNNVEDYRRYIQALALEMARKEKPEGRLTKDDITRILNTIQDVKRSMPKGILQKAKGGRVSGYGGGITATMPRIPMGTPRVNAGGIRELDYRAEGGFVPVGVKEKADDVPAMLSKNEFVMTADAVKGAGGGSVEKGAQRMYNTMKKLEGRVA